MARYFTGSSTLEGLERMMMDPSRTTPAHTEPRRKMPQKKPPCDRPVGPHPHEQEIKERDEGRPLSSGTREYGDIAVH